MSPVIDDDDDDDDGDDGGDNDAAAADAAADDDDDDDDDDADDDAINYRFPLAVECSCAPKFPTTLPQKYLTRFLTFRNIGQGQHFLVWGQNQLSHLKRSISRARCETEPTDWHVADHLDLRQHLDHDEVDHDDGDGNDNEQDEVDHDDDDGNLEGASLL